MSSSEAPSSSAVAVVVEVVKDPLVATSVAEDVVSSSEAPSSSAVAVVVEVVKDPLVATGV